MVLADERHQPAIVDVALLGVECPLFPKRLQRVVELSEGKVLMLGEHLLA